MQVFKFLVPEDGPHRVGRFLLRHGFSRQALTKAKFADGMILVNHHRRYSGFKLQAGDEVIFLPATEAHNERLRPCAKPVDIVFETKQYLVLNKPAGLLSVPAHRAPSDSVVNRLLAYFQPDQPDAVPHVVTRLDRDTSGLMLVAKTAIAHARFSQYHKDIFIKKYRALVHGSFETTSGLIDQPIGQLLASVKHAVMLTGKPAQTRYQVLHQTESAAQVELQLLTGRTHQIRVHLAYLGHPLFGDQLYGKPDGFGRQALNCCELQFPDPFTKAPVQLKIPDPADMQELLKKCLL